MITLFCFPYAGADGKAYAPLEAFADNHLKVVPLELPGRGERYREPISGSIDEMVDDCFRQLEGKLHSPFAVFGHSMGALLSYLFARKLEEKELSMPLHLFVSGCAAPAVVMTASRRRMLQGKEWESSLEEVMGIPTDMLDNEVFRIIYEPLIRQDLVLFKQYHYREQAPFDIPVTVFTGTEDRVTADEMAAWQRETNHRVSIVPFNGKHHFWRDYPEEIMTIIKKQFTV
ncbi:thioesterase II family protein [Chitinophaga sp. Ak27]|uniref:thioesterase II family protein n=1 Tax=Chitinophaga sp. Ak27 TaxID=2726116 RepID=UPI00145F29C2|nr:alpha/beta fold hydrolase [Chitinophaga sp. Ak27]NLU92392.1 thioesterase [Chitinophaga sp. Ak27]